MNGTSRSLLSKSHRRVSWRLVPQQRRIHRRVQLKYDVETGLGDFLPPQALKTVAVDFQQGLLDRLNDLVQNTEYERKSVVQTVIGLASDRENTLAFNYASQALNNSFFLSNLKPIPENASSHESSIPHHVLSRIREQFGSLDQLRSTASAVAMGMSSSGWVWLVTDRTGELAIVPTFGAGTLLVRSRMQNTPFEGPSVGEVYRNLNGEPIEASAGPEQSTSPPVNPIPSSTTPAGVAPSSPTSGVSSAVPPLSPSAGPARTYATSSFLDRKVPNIFSPTSSSPLKQDYQSVGKTLFPLFCISVHEHAWISAGYGVWGKEEWLKKFWTVLDWETVSASFENFTTHRRVY